MTRHRVVDSPVGPLALLERGGGVAALHMDVWSELPGDWGPRDDTVLPDLVAQLEEYFAGRLTGFDVRVTATGTPWQQQVWAALREVPYGETRSYGEVAAALGRPTASRAVGAANGRNPVGIVVPCHRVVAADGTLHGYAGGVERKRFLLDLERRAAVPTLL